MKEYEMENMVRSLSEESEFSGTGGNWMTVLPKSPVKKDFGEVLFIYSSRKFDSISKLSDASLQHYL